MSRYSFVAPLAGRQEAAGDVVLRDLNARWNLIEFKRTAADIQSELLKYDHRGEAFGQLAEFLCIGSKSAPHFIVFGCCDELGMLELRAQHYWGRWTGVKSAEDRHVEVESIPKLGREYDHFVKYLTALLSIKSKTASGSAGSLQFNAVVGIAGDRVVTASLSDFIDRTPKLARQIQVTPPAPDLTMPEPNPSWGMEP